MDYYPNQPQQTSQLGETGLPNIGQTSSPEVSVVMPCLNEADTLKACLEKAQSGVTQIQHRR